MGLGAPVDGRRTLVDADPLFRSKGIPLDALETQGAAIGKRGRSPRDAEIDGRAAAVIVPDPVKPARPLRLAKMSPRNSRGSI